MASHPCRLPARTFGIADENIYAMFAQESYLRFEVLMGEGLTGFPFYVTTCNLVDHY
jgi:hypothetical protein